MRNNEATTMERHKAELYSRERMELIEAAQEADADGKTELATAYRRRAARLARHTI